nr:MAG TPA: hypothetical protein [Caudoviricetes sp.]
MTKTVLRAIINTVRTLALTALLGRCAKPPTS